MKGSGVAAGSARGLIRVLHVVLDMDLGGLQRVVNILVRNMDQSVFTPSVCCLDRGGLFLEGLEQDGFETTVLGRRPGLFDARLFARLVGLVRRKRIEVIHSHNGCTLYGALAGRLGGVRGIVHTDHGRLVPDRQGAILEDRYCSRMINAFVGVSEELTEYLAATVGVGRSRLRTVINGVDCDHFHPFSAEQRRQGRRELGLPEDSLVLGTLCRLDPIKNLGLMVRGFSEVSSRLPGSVLVIAGDGPSERELKEQVAALGLEGSVMFLGRRDDPEKILPLLDLYLSTSHSEGTSMTILEAMACCVPVVATAVGGNVRLVDESVGVLVPPGDEGVLLQEVARLLSAPRSLSALGEGARRVAVERYAAAHFVRAYEDLYREVCELRVDR